MKIALCFPPETCLPTSPFGSLPLLSACLRRAGHEVLPLDLSALTFHRLVRRETPGPCDHTSLMGAASPFAMLLRAA